MSSSSTKPGAALRLQQHTWRWMEASYDMCRGVFSGVWLGVLSRRQRHELGALSYDSPNPHLSEDFNRGGMFPWETRVINTHFEGCRNLVVLGAGAGRECKTLLDRGFETDGFEVNDGLRRAGAEWFGSSFAARCLQPMQMDICPPLHTVYDGVVIGWGMFTLIEGRQNRVEMLRTLRAACHTGAPLLLSFFIRSGSRRPFRIGAAIAGALRRIRRADAPEYGDAMAPAFAHYFTREELETELRDGGWTLIVFDRRAYPHAVARAV